MLKRAVLQNYTQFEHLELGELAGINVFVGVNDSGKTSLLKLFYAVTHALQTAETSQKDRGQYRKLIADKLFDTFQPRTGRLAELHRKGSSGKTEVRLEYLFGETAAASTCFTLTNRSERDLESESTTVAALPDQFKVLFLPAKEVLTAHQAIRYTREPNYRFGFDDTYYDLVKALNVPGVQGRLQTNLSDVNQALEQLFEGEVLQNKAKDDFLFRKKQGSEKVEFTMGLTAEGIKKIGILTTLIRNRELNSTTMLFIDEPETALHPKAQRQFVHLLAEMRRAGLQLMIATHSYFILKQFQLEAMRLNESVLCHELSRGPSGFTVQTSDLREGMPDNEIVRQSLEMFEEELKLEAWLSTRKVN